MLPDDTNDYARREFDAANQRIDDAWMQRYEVWKAAHGDKRVLTGETEAEFYERTYRDLTRTPKLRLEESAQFTHRNAVQRGYTEADTLLLRKLGIAVD